MKINRQIDIRVIKLLNWGLNQASFKVSATFRDREQFYQILRKNLYKMKFNLGVETCELPEQ